MAKQKTNPTAKSVQEFIEALDNERKQKEAFLILELMKDITQLEPRMWGTSIIGFGRYHYQYESGHEGHAPQLSFSPRKQKLVLYVLTNFEKQAELLEQLGKFKTGKVCLYINKLADVDFEVLKKIIHAAWESAPK